MMLVEAVREGRPRVPVPDAENPAVLAVGRMDVGRLADPMDAEAASLEEIENAE